ncbi:MAG: hypothetical protein ACLTDV_03690 [Eubacterium sp.]
MGETRQREEGTPDEAEYTLVGKLKGAWKHMKQFATMVYKSLNHYGEASVMLKLRTREDPGS